MAQPEAEQRSQPRPVPLRKPGRGIKLLPLCHPPAGPALSSACVQPPSCSPLPLFLPAGTLIFPLAQRFHLQLDPLPSSLC